MAEKSEYDLQREERIRRNQAMLARLQVQDSANEVSEPARAAQAKAAAAKEARRQKFVATGPVRKSSRAGAVQTAARLQAQAEAHSSDDELSGSPSSQDGNHHSNSNNAAEGSDMSSHGTKRKRCAVEEEFDPADVAEGSEVSSSDSEADKPENDSQSGSADQQDEAISEQDEEELHLQQALAMSLQDTNGSNLRPPAARSQQSSQLSTQKAVDLIERKAAAKQQPKVAAKKQPKAAAKKPAQHRAGKKGKKPKGRTGLQEPTQQEMKAAFALLNPGNRSVINAQDILQAADGLGYNFSEDEVSAMMEFAVSITERASTSSMTFQGFQKLVAHYSQTA